MITQAKSWIHDDNIPNFIGRKKVDWSTFEYGSTIPKEIEIFFSRANDGYIFISGDVKNVILVNQGLEYRATMRKVKLQDRELLQINFSNEVKSQILQVFQRSYQYLLNQRSKYKNKLIEVPDNQAEYIEFYSTGIPFRFQIKFISLGISEPSIWWVNQGKTLDKELKEGVIWAPLIGKNGRSNYHWDTVDEVKKGDIIVHYANGYLQYVGQATEDSTRANKPDSMADSMWEQEGRLVKVKYYPLEPKIPLDSFAKDIFNMRIKQGPINSSYRVNQGYLFRFNKEGLVKIMKSVPRVRWPEFVDVFINQIDSHNEDIEFIGDIEVRNMLKKFTSFIRNRGFSYPDLLIENFYLSLKTKPFVILAGVSGTGKTKLVKLFAEAVGASTDNGQFTLIPVRPDWSDPSDLIGYKDLSGVFRPGPLTQVLVEAAQPHNRDKPFFVCLDEMNLARVEHYFSDLLSILETQQWSGDRIVTDPVIRRETLDTEDDRDRYGELYLPDNVYIIGTVNMDETTHPFSKKVLVVSRQVV